MDFFIKASYAGDLAIQSNDVSFIDDHRVIIMSITLVISIMSFCWQLVKHFKLDKSEKINTYQLDIREGYWHQSILLPLFVDKFVENITKWVDDINLSNDLAGVDRRDNFKKEIVELQSRTQLLCTVNETARNNINDKLDNIEDIINSYLYNSSNISESEILKVKSKIFSNAEDIIKELMDDHQRLDR